MKAEAASLTPRRPSNSLPVVFRPVTQNRHVCLRGHVCCFDPFIPHNDHISVIIRSTRNICHSTQCLQTSLPRQAMMAHSHSLTQGAEAGRSVQSPAIPTASAAYCIIEC